MKFLLPAFMAVFLFACSKNDDSGSSGEEKLTANSWQQTNTTAATNDQKPVAVFTANHDFSLNLNSAVSGAGSNSSVGAAITGKWSYDGSNITISNISVSYQVNGTAAANLQAVVNAYAGGLVAFNTFIQAYCNLLQVDASGNLMIQGASSNTVTWVVNQLTSSVLVVASAGASASFTAKQ
ncbi:hypothetical protein [Niabella drilacis]|uniref:Uncharacterized protein n=1 Tax=Niabella drilacis (strain DSM 25811 / CCM 8410 / CCUG 62505 / LMG 26954 / E90) TaxID=1285928 RepID=A0A1G6N4M3_NIADE|nr:hypothetical protein [Niabella drilacis]SDC62779.1 hypothetical protein SAMN04487894_103151 [Niabella drilacis]